jgi:hypothetical protein
MPKKGYRQTPQHRARIAAALRERLRTPEECEAISRGLTGRNLSEEHKQRIGAGVRRAAREYAWMKDATRRAVQPGE